MNLRKYIKKSFSWTFEELEDCGWTWGNSSSDLTISNTLEILGDPHQLTHSGITVDIATAMNPIHLSCDYSNAVTVDMGFVANHTAFGQDGAQSGSTDFTSAFVIQLNEFNHTANTTFISDGVMVGEELQVC